MFFRELEAGDFVAVHRVRMAVKENQLSDPSKVTLQDYSLLLKNRGKGWLCESGGEVVGFAIADVAEGSVWTLFVLPEFEGKGIGKTLHKLMVNYCLGEGLLEKLWLSTDPATRGEAFYQKAGWKPVGVEKNGEIKFELTKKDWQRRGPAIHTEGFLPVIDECSLKEAGCSSRSITS